MSKSACAMEHVEHLVVGAGISGLAFVNWLDSEDYLIVEAEEEPGGYCRTVHQDGFVWDYSGHFFHFRHPYIEQHLVERMDGRVRKIERCSRIAFGDRLIDFPFQKNIHQLPRQDFIDCLVDLYFRPKHEPTDFKDMLTVKFGESIAKKFLVPYNEKLYATDLATLDVEAMGRFFPHADVDEIIANFRSSQRTGYNATFTYPERGAVQYVQALLRGIDERKLSLNERLESIDLSKRVARTSRRQVRYESLISSMPFDQLLRAAQVPHEPSVYSCNKVEVFNLGFDRKALNDVHWVYFPQRERVFYRVGFYDNIFDTDRASLYVEVGYPRDAVLEDASLQRRLRRVLSDLEQARIITSQHQLLASHHVILDPAYVHITKRSMEDFRLRSGAFADQGVYSIGRYGSWTYCSIEDNIVQARGLARRMNTA